MTVETTPTGLEIAIIGMAGRFPGALDLESFWDNLVGGRGAISLLSDEELRAAGVHPSLLGQANFVKARGVFPELEFFDADFFDYTPRDGAMLDPQVRALHQGVYHALEDAGYASEGYTGAIGLFAGASGNFLWELSTLLEAQEGSANQLAAIQLNDKDFLATRIAYKLNLRGPAVSIHSACSTSLYAVDLACRYLLTGACNLAIAAGSGLTLPHRNGYLYEAGMIKSADGVCRPFSEDANGTVEGNGMGVVVLKPLEDALADRDRIYAVIRGTASNNDGSRKVGYTAPSVEGQAEVIRRALHMAEVEPETVDYVEAHGTGTALGDPVEIEGLRQAFGEGRSRPCGIGSLKSGIGHLDTAAGISSLIKTALALERRLIPPSLHFKAPNPVIDFAASGFEVITEATPWNNRPLAGQPERFEPRRAGVSSFGIGGTNVHVVLEEAPPLAPATPGRDWQVLCLSARSEAALARLEAALAAWLQDRPDVDPADLAYTFQTGRRNLPLRSIVPFRDGRELLETLTGEGKGPERFPAVPARSRVAFLFPGQGSQYPGMAAGLYASEPVFREQLDRCLTLCQGLGLGQLRSLLLDPNADADALRDTALAQPALFVVEYALARLLMEWGIRPAAMIGHSLGEYVAACLAGVFTLEQALELVVTRGRLLGDLPGGAMLGVGAAEADLLPLLGEGVELAAVNGPTQCTVAGSHQAVAALEETLQARGILARPLHTSHAFHSALMEPAGEPLARLVERLQPQAPQLAYLSNLTGDWITPDQARDPDYYARHLRQPVRFAAGAARLLEEEGLVAVEVGPGTVLGTFLRQNGGTARPVTTLPPAREADQAERYLARALGQIWGQGVVPDWRACYRGQQRNRLAAPLYPFEKRPFPLGRGDIYTLLEGVSQTQKPQAPAPAPAREKRESRGPMALGWQTALLPPPADAFSVRPCLVFCNNRRSTRALGLVSGLRPVHVYPGRSFAPKKRGYRMDPNRVSDYRRLIQALGSGEGVPELLILVAEVGTNPLEGPLGDCLLRLAMTLGDQCPGRHFRCLIFLPGPQSLLLVRHPEEDFGLDALARGIRVAQPGFELRFVRLDETAGPESQAEWMEREIYDTDTALHLTGYSGPRQRWAYRAAAQPGAAHGDPPQTESFRDTRLGLMAPEGYPLDELATRLREVSGARVVPLTYRNQRPRHQASVLEADQEEQGRFLRKIQKRYLRQYGLVDYTRAHALMDELCTALVVDYLQPRCPLEPGRTLTRQALKDRLEVTDRLERYLDYFLQMLLEDGLIEEAGEGYQVVKGPEALRPTATIKAELEEASPLFTGQVELLERCVAAYPEALPERLPPIQVLYPQGSNELLKRTYEGSIQEREDDYIRLLFGRLIERIVQGARGRQGAPLRILEAGGGYGVMMRRIVPLLKGLKVEYYFTDIGQTFLDQARDFALAEGLDFMTFGLFDITRSPREQGLELQSFDLVFAFNVVHATRSLGETLDHLRVLLRGGGLLCLLERTRIRRYVDLIWGLADGWWHFDADERSRSPLMELEQWQALLERLGFDQVLAYPDLAEARRRLDVGILVAQTPRARVSEADLPADPWRFDEPPGQPLDGLVVVEAPPAGRVAPFQPLGESLVRPRAGLEGYGPALLDWLERHPPGGFVTLWSPGRPLSDLREEAARVRAAVTLDRRGRRLLARPDCWSRLQLPFEPDDPQRALPDARSIGQALRAVEGGLTLGVIRPEAQPLFNPPRPQAGTSRPGPDQAAGNAALAAGADGYGRLLTGLWEQLFGLEAIGPDDDFFELGGDSLKVAQLTTELERHGIKLMSNEVFNHPTIAALAAYLEVHHRQGPGQITTVDELLAHCQETLGVTAVYRSQELDGQPCNLLYLGHWETGREDLEETLGALPNHLQPHYLLPLERLEEDPLQVLGLGEAGGEEAGALLRRIRDQQMRLGLTLCSGEVEGVYPLSPFQKMYLKGSARFSLYLIDFDEPLDVDRLEQALTDVVALQGLLRSSLRAVLGRLGWSEHRAPHQRLRLPVADLSGYRPSEQARLVERLMEAEYRNDFDTRAGVMWRVLLIRLDRRRHTLLFNLDHSIFDNMSGQVLRRQLVNHYRALGTEQAPQLEPIRSFRDYLEQLNQGPQGTNERRLVELFELERYEQVKLAVEARINADRQPTIGQLRYRLDLNRFDLSDDDEATWELSVVLLCYVLGRFLEQEAVPLKIVYQGRKYQDQPYFDTLGLFVDVLPLLVEIDRDDPAAMIEGIRNKVRFVNRYNVSFMNMLLNLTMRFKWWKVLAHIAPKKLPQRDPMILLNYAGKAEREYQKVIDFATRQLQNSGGKLDYASFYTIVTVVDGHLVFDIFCSFAPDMARLEELFDQEVQRLLPGGPDSGIDQTIDEDIRPGVERIA